MRVDLIARVGRACCPRSPVPRHLQLRMEISSSIVSTLRGELYESLTASVPRSARALNERGFDSRVAAPESPENIYF